MTQVDPFAGFQSGPIPLYKHHARIQPSDDEDLPVRPLAIRCLGTDDEPRGLAGGYITVRDEDGTDFQYFLEYGEYLHLRAVRVLATGTDSHVVFMSYW